MEEKKITRGYTIAEKVSLLWFSIDAFTHLTIELGYVCLALGDTARRSDTAMGKIWREYARADARWAIRDANVISIEILTVLVGIVICVAELYGGWMTFAPEWLEGSPNLDGSTFSLLWIYLVFMNGLWVVVPLALLWDSGARLTDAVRQLERPVDLGFPKTSPSQTVHYLVLGLIVLYLILVPAVLSQAEEIPADRS
eukprot:scaffold2621_cov164-Ochromonas_danica.AAC.3